MKNFLIGAMQIMRAVLFLLGMVLIVIEAPTESQQWIVTGSGILCFALCALPELIGILADVLKNGVEFID